MMPRTVLLSMSRTIALIVTVILYCAGATAESAFPALASSELDPDLKGLVLIQELNCVSCHASDTTVASQSKKAPRLSEVGTRVNPNYIEAFISDPHSIKPGTSMPDVLAQLSETEKRQAANSITHFLLSLKKSEFSLQAPDSVAAQYGKRLFHSRGCAACHSPRDDKGTELLAKTSVPLGALEKKYSFKSLVDFLRQPHASRPSGRMPDLRLAGQDIERIAHYLLQNTRVPGPLAYTLYRGQVWEGLESDNVTAARAGLVQDFALESLGNIQHHTAIRYEGWINIPKAGRYSFFLKMNGGSLLLDNAQIVKHDPSDGRGVKQLDGSAELMAGWRKIQILYFHTGREPKFFFEMEGPDFKRQSIPSSMLSISNEKIPEFQSPKVDVELAARGREQFGKLGCANCHNDVSVAPVNSAPPLSKLNTKRGCLSEVAGPWPRFDLSANQRGLIARILPLSNPPKLSEKQQLEMTLTALNCIACHERAGLGKIAPERNALFTGTHEALGDQGRLPPPLTHVGAKLKPEWITEVLVNGRRQRSYLDASMPQFGEANVGHLVELFGKVDTLESASIPNIANVQEFKNAGHEMIGITGFSCITCHDFNGQKSGVGALDIAYVTERLKKNWFHLYMRQPRRFHPTVVMPEFWPDGESIRPNILGGDTTRQIEALWSYLEDGIRAKKPIGLSRQSNEIRVGAVTEICRGRSPIGYRGIAVGYPERINLAYNSEEMALRQLWKGDFANVDLGSFQALGTDRISLPPGIPFYRLKTMEESWPYKAKTNYLFPQDNGYQFRGYHLDAMRRPTFHFLYGDIVVADFFEDLRDKNGKAYFKRTLSFDSPSEQQLFHFRAAAGKKIATQSANQFSVDQLQLRITSDHKGNVRESNLDEVLIPLTLPKGRSTLTLEYQW